MSWLATRSIRELDLINPDPKSVNILDIAFGLARECRFGNQVRNVSFYSVAEHTLNVAQMMQSYGPRVQLCALHHDDSEAYLKDLPTPVKQLCPDYQALEARVTKCINTALQLPTLTKSEYDLIHKFDKELGGGEYYNYMEDHGPIPEYPPHQVTHWAKAWYLHHNYLLELCGMWDQIVPWEVANNG